MPHITANNEGPNRFEAVRVDMPGGQRAQLENEVNNAEIPAPQRIDAPDEVQRGETWPDIPDVLNNPPEQEGPSVGFNQVFVYENTYGNTGLTELEAPWETPADDYALIRAINERITGDISSLCTIRDTYGLSTTGKLVRNRYTIMANPINIPDLKGMRSKGAKLKAIVDLRKQLLDLSKKIDNNSLPSGIWRDRSNDIVFAWNMLVGHPVLVDKRRRVAQIGVMPVDPCFSSMAQCGTGVIVLGSSALGLSTHVTNVCCIVQTFNGRMTENCLEARPNGRGHMVIVLPDVWWDRWSLLMQQGIAVFPKLIDGAVSEPGGYYPTMNGEGISRCIGRGERENNRLENEVELLTRLPSTWDLFRSGCVRIMTPSVVENWPIQEVAERIRKIRMNSAQDGRLVKAYVSIASNFILQYAKPWSIAQDGDGHTHTYSIDFINGYWSDLQSMTDGGGNRLMDIISRLRYRGWLASGLPGSRYIPADDSVYRIPGPVRVKEIWDMGYRGWYGLTERGRLVVKSSATDKQWTGDVLIPENESPFGVPYHSEIPKKWSMKVEHLPWFKKVQTEWDGKDTLVDPAWGAMCPPRLDS